MTDELIILLSMDWFLPYWPEIGIRINESKKGYIQQGCRGIVPQILGNAQWMFQADFSERRKRETEASFLALLAERDVLNDISGTYQEWKNKTDKEKSATWNYFILTKIINSGKFTEDYPVLHTDISSWITDSWKKFDFDSLEIRNACSIASTEWDLRMHSALGGPDSVYGIVMNILRDHTLQAFWKHLRQNLSEGQLRELVSWYRAMTIVMTRGERPDLLPSYIDSAIHS